MVAVILVVPFQKAVGSIFPDLSFYAIIIWAALEEVFKLVAGYFGGLHSTEDNEPIDSMIYMITAALGFVALENTLFIFSPIQAHDLSQTILTGNMRFLGASILHIVTSGVVGAGLSIGFYQARARKWKLGILALIGAIIIHSAFNLIIVHLAGWGMPLAFLIVWLSAVLLLLMFERVKLLRPDVDGL